MSLEAASRDEVSRVLGRAAFGATAADLDRWTGRPYGELVEFLVSFPARGARGPAFDDGRRGAVQESGKAQGPEQGGPTALAQMWWLERMRTTAYPLEERMTLFWHGHFATSAREQYPDVAMMMRQNETLRQHALGNFRDLVQAITIDPAMLEWLDGTRNTIPVPNENYARELLELFTLGKYPQIYTEDDVREAARALTGWACDRLLYGVAFDERFHDKGSKTILGTTFANAGAQEYKTVVDIALKQPVAAAFLAYKLVSNFAYVPSNANLLTAPDPLVATVANRLRATDWNVREAIRALLMSDEFRLGAPGARHQLVRQPVEVVVAAGKTLDFSLNEELVTAYLGRMGQQLFVPPNVGGWPTATSWLSPATVLGRYDFGLFAQSQARAPLPASSDLDGWARLMGLPALTEATTGALRAFLADSASEPEAAKQASVLVLMLSMPEWAVM